MIKKWSPDGRLLLFSLKSGELHLYDNQGSFVVSERMVCVIPQLKLISVSIDEAEYTMCSIGSFEIYVRCWYVLVPRKCFSKSSSTSYML